VRAVKRTNELRQTVTKLSAKLNDLRKAEKEAQAAKTAAKEARIAKEAAEAKAAKEAAGGQKAGAKGGKNKTASIVLTETSARSDSATKTHQTLFQCCQPRSI